MLKGIRASLRRDSDLLQCARYEKELELGREGLSRPASGGGPRRRIQVAVWASEPPPARRMERSLHVPPQSLTRSLSATPDVYDTRSAISMTAILCLRVVVRYLRWSRPLGWRAITHTSKRLEDALTVILEANEHVYSSRSGALKRALADALRALAPATRRAEDFSGERSEPLQSRVQVRETFFLSALRALLSSVRSASCLLEHLFVSRGGNLDRLELARPRHHLDRQVSAQSRYRLHRDHVP